MPSLSPRQIPFNREPILLERHVPFHRLLQIPGAGHLKRLENLRPRPDLIAQRLPESGIMPGLIPRVAPNPLDDRGTVVLSLKNPVQITSEYAYFPLSVFFLWCFKFSSLNWVSYLFCHHKFINQVFILRLCNINYWIMYLGFIIFITFWLYDHNLAKCNYVEEASWYLFEEGIISLTLLWKWLFADLFDIICTQKCTW